MFGHPVMLGLSQVSTGGLLEEVQNLKFKVSLDFLRWIDFFCKKKTRDLNLILAPNRTFFPGATVILFFSEKKQEEI